MRLGGTVFNWGKDPALFAQKHVEKGFTAAVCPDFLNAGDTAMNTLFVRELESYSRRSARGATPYPGIKSWLSKTLSI